MHRIFGYRGVILFPWTARVYDRDSDNPKKQITATTTPTPTQCAKEASPLRVNAGSSEGSGTTATSQLDDAPTSWHASNSATDTQRATNLGTAKTTTNANTSSATDAKDVKGKTQTFYQVLIDTRDCPYIVSECFCFPICDKLTDTLF